MRITLQQGEEGVQALDAADAVAED